MGGNVPIFVCRHYAQKRSESYPSDYEKKTPGKKPLVKGTFKGCWAVHVYNRTGRKIRTEYYKDDEGKASEVLWHFIDA